MQHGGEQHQQLAGVAVDVEVALHAVVQEDVHLQLHVQQLVRSEHSLQAVQVPTHSENFSGSPSLSDYTTSTSGNDACEFCEFKLDKPYLYQKKMGKGRGRRRGAYPGDNLF